MSRNRARLAPLGWFVVAGGLAALTIVFADADSSDALLPRAVIAFVASDSGSVFPTPAPSMTPTATPTGTVTPTPTAPASFDSARALETSRYLSEEIGVRVAGTGAEQRAAEYIHGRFADAGYDVELMPFAMTSAYVEASVLVQGQGIPATALTGSGGAAVTAPAVFAGLGTAADFAGKEVAGRVAVMERGVLTFNQKVANAQGAGAIAVIIINSEPEGFSGSLGASFPLPVVGVSGAYRALLASEAAAGHPVTVSVEFPGSIATNVIARPSPGDSCRIVVGGHYDTVPGSPGANDNASGTATVIEIARASGNRPGVCFVAFSGEESGLWGSAALADRLRLEGRLPAYMVNLDVTGVGEGVDVIGSPGLRSRALQVAASIGVSASLSTLPENTSSDHASFLAAGVPVVMFTSGDFSLIHTPADTFARLDEAEMDAVGEVALALVLELAGEP